MVPARARPGSRVTAVGLALAVLVAPARALQGPEPNRVDYEIQARLDGELKRLHGEETIEWTNHTSGAADELWFHLYLNGFANNRSTHMLESKGKLRDKEVEDGWGWQRVSAVKVDGVDCLPSFRYRTEAGESAEGGEDRTVFSIQPSKPIAPGGTAKIEIEWESQIPRVRRRTGYKGDFLFMAQWFPKLGVFEEGRGWNAHIFHASTEFYSDYGTYEVTLDLPAEYEKKVGGSGVLIPTSERHGDRVVMRFIAPSPADQVRADSTGKRPLVHDFAWAADPDFKVKTKTFHAELWRSRFPEEVEYARRALGRDADLALRNVEVRLLMQPEHEPQWERHFEATCTALFFYGLWFGEYPYEHITVVDPAWGASEAGGMEYPTIFTAGTRLFTTEDMHSPEGVTVHECGHQFWYGLVGNNEFEAAWMDEGFNSFSDAEALFRNYGKKRATTVYSGLPVDGVLLAPAPGGGAWADALAAARIPLPWFDFDLVPLRSSGFVDFWRDQPLLTASSRFDDPRWHDRISYLADPARDPVDRPAYEYVDRLSYRTNSYPRPAVALRTLAGVVGYEKFLAGMRHYAETWRYRHPYPDDFFASFNEGAGVDASWYFDAVFRSTDTVDWSVSVEQRRDSRARGFFQQDPLAEFVELEAQDREPAASDPPAPAEDSTESASDDEKRPWIAEVLVVRGGDLQLPLAIELRFDDGSSERRTWTREEQARRSWLELVHRGDKKLMAVVLDPERAYFLDTDLSNNAWFEEVDTVTPARWTERVFNRYLHLLHWQAGVGG